MDFYLYMYKCNLIRIIDGDTLECNIDLGFNILKKSILRLQDIDAPELKTKDLLEKAHAVESTEALKHIILNENISDEMKLFHMQQLSEKYVKYICCLINLNNNDESSKRP